ncbi:hypothetical protein NDU88_006007 [Pleurodeles waltl]|uniref:Uncharacterized protein n=1 Tax=Pleurodeles waltl TaxID=8319 RepID=A0AAV7TCA2_PLEWA|nr:hypothetical protein NDU88_006007 [Pleurodeles waltl]
MQVQGAQNPIRGKTSLPGGLSRSHSVRCRGSPSQPVGPPAWETLRTASRLFSVADASPLTAPIGSPRSTWAVREGVHSPLHPQIHLPVPRGSALQWVSTLSAIPAVSGPRAPHRSRWSGPPLAAPGRCREVTASVVRRHYTSIRQHKGVVGDGM